MHLSQSGCCSRTVAGALAELLVAGAAGARPSRRSTELTSMVALKLQEVLGWRDLPGRRASVDRRTAPQPASRRRSPPVPSPAVLAGRATVLTSAFEVAADGVPPPSASVPLIRRFRPVPLTTTCGFCARTSPTSLHPARCRSRRRAPPARVIGRRKLSTAGQKSAASSPPPPAPSAGP